MLLDPKNQVEILNGLAGRPLAQVVQARNDDEALSRGIERKTNVAEVRVSDVLNLRQTAGRPDANEAAAI